MAYVYGTGQVGEQRSDFPSTRSEVLQETFAQAYEDNPLQSLIRIDELARAGFQGEKLDAETARAKAKAAGVDLKIDDAGITQAALDTLIERKQTEQRRAEIFARAAGGFGEGAERFGINLATGMSDPVSAAASFIPFVGEERYGALLARAARSSAPVLARTGVRAAVGAAEGAGGQALLEPITAVSRLQQQDDYTLADTALDVTFGGLMGAGFHTLSGGIGDVYGAYRARSRIPRAEGLTGEQRAIEQRFANQVSGDIDRAVEDYAKVDGTDNGRVINTDLARELSADYRADRTQSAAVHEPASYLTKQIYERKLAEPAPPGMENEVLFTAGGTGAGKTTSLEVLRRTDPSVDRAQIIYDTNMNNARSATQKIEQALAAGKNVRVLYTFREPTDALVNGALPRAERMGRTVPLEEHAKTHVGAAKVVKELSAKYAGDDRVRIDVIDNSHGKGGAVLSDVARVPELDYNSVLENLSHALESERAAGRISDATYRGTAPRAQGTARSAGAEVRGRPQSGDSRTGALERFHEELSPKEREDSIRAAVVHAVDDTLLPPEKPGSTPEEASAILARERSTDEPTIDGLANAKDESAIALADLKAVASKLGVEAEDDSLKAVNEAAKRAERWARAAEIATTCLVRGG